MAELKHKPLVLFGGGGHAKVVISILKLSGRVVDAIYDEDKKKWGNQLLGVRIQPFPSPCAVGFSGLIAIGDNASRGRLAGKSDCEWITAIHPAAFVDPSAHIGPGSVIGAGAIIQPDVVIGAHVIVNSGATVDHDCVISDFVHIGPGAHLAGAVNIGHGAFLGIGCSILPGVNIGEWTIAGAGSVVTRDLPRNVVAVGVPAKIISP